MDEQNPDQNSKQKTKVFGAPRMRATELLDVLREEGQDVTELSHELETTTYIDPEVESDEKTTRKRHRKKNTYADLAPKPGVTPHAQTMSAQPRAKSSAPSGHRVGSFFIPDPVDEDIPYPPDIPTPEEKSLGIGSSFYSTEQQVFNDNLTMPTPNEASVGVGNSFYSTEQQVFPSNGNSSSSSSHLRGSANANGNGTGALGVGSSFYSTEQQIFDNGSASNLQPEVAHHSAILDSHSLAEAENVQFDPNSAMAKLLASTENATGAGAGAGIGGATGAELDFGSVGGAAGTVGAGFEGGARAAEMDPGQAARQEQPGLSWRPGRRNPSAGNPAYSEAQLSSEELEEYRFIKGDESLSDFANSTKSVHPQVQNAIDQMSQEMTNGLYNDAPGHFPSPLERRQKRGASSQVVPDYLIDEGVEQLGQRSTFTPSSAPSAPFAAGSDGFAGGGYGAEVQVGDDGQVSQGMGYRGSQAHSSGLGDNPSIRNNYIPDATPSPMPSFTPSAYTSPYADVTNNQAVTHVVDGEVVADDASATLREEYASLLANKQAAQDMLAAEHSTSPIYHPWTLAKNRISKEELLRQKAAAKAQAELNLNPMYRLQIECNNVEANLDNFSSSAMGSGASASAQAHGGQLDNLPPPPEAHLLAQDAALGLPVENPLLLQSAKGSLIATIDFNGGMLSQLIYQRKSGQLLDLFYHAPWLKDNYFFRSPNLEQHMAGEWPCVPFGWCVSNEEANRAVVQHGYACQNRWNLEMVLTSQAEFLQYVDNPEAELVSEDGEEGGVGAGVVMSYQYPEDMPLEKIVRSLYINDHDVLFNFTLYPRSDCKVPMAAYPLFAMNPENDLVMLDIEGDGLVYPRQYEPGVSRFLQKSHFFSLDSIALRKDFVNKDGNGLSADATVLPFRYPTEEVVQMLNPKGRARLYYPNKQLHLVLKWEEEKFPNCVVWISNGGRNYAPWEGQSYCLGVAPMIGTWDMADEALQANNLIEQRGQPTYVQLKADQRFSFSYSLFIEDLKPDDDMAAD